MIQVDTQKYGSICIFTARPVFHGSTCIYGVSPIFCTEKFNYFDIYSTRTLNLFLFVCLSNSASNRLPKVAARVGRKTLRN